MLASLETLPKWEPPAVTTTVHRVRSGETLGMIASKYHTSVNELMSLNRLRSAHRLSVGQQLQVPDRSGGSSRSSSSACELGERQRRSAPGNVYVVQVGDTLGSIAEREKVSLDRLLAENELTQRSMILPGQRLRIPGSS